MQEEDRMPKAAAHVEQLGQSFIPQLVALHDDWVKLFMDEELVGAEPVLGGSGAAKSLTRVSGLRFVPVYNGCAAFGPFLAPNFFMTACRNSLPGELDPPFADV